MASISFREKCGTFKKRWFFNSAFERRTHATGRRRARAPQDSGAYVRSLRTTEGVRAASREDSILFLFSSLREEVTTFYHFWRELEKGHVRREILNLEVEQEDPLINGEEESTLSS